MAQKVGPAAAGMPSVPDFSDMTCTNLMIRLKMLLKNATPDAPVECIVRRDQRDTIEVPFSRTGYTVDISRLDTNHYLVRLMKKESAGQP